MSVPSVDVNYLAILVVAILNMVVGSIWYAPSLFGKKMMKYAAIPPKILAKMKKSMASSYSLAFVSSLVLNFVLATFVAILTASTFLQGMFVGFMVWLGFVVTIMLGSVLWEGKSFKLYLINAFYYLVNLLIAGGILAIWR